MQPREEIAIPVHRRRERDGMPVNERRRRSAVSDGRLTRIVAGSYAPTAAWESLRPIDRHHLRVVEAVDRARSSLVVSHFAAASVWGIDMIGRWPGTVDVLVPRTSGGRSSGTFRRRTTSADDAATVPWRGHEVTTPAQTVLDIARISGFTAGVVACDQALWQRRPGGALATSEELDELLSGRAPRRGHARARAAVEFATSSSDSVRESQSRVLIARLGFPAPELQRRFVLPSGRVAFSDFWWPAYAHAGEFDGVGKYVDPELLRGRAPEEALLDEKDRGDELCRVVRRLSRWRVPALTDPRRLYDILAGDGLPTSRPRPPRGLVF